VLTYAELAADHLAHARTYQKQPQNTEFVMKNHLIPRWGKTRLDEITSQDIAKWFAEKAKAGLAPATIDKLRTVFGRSFELARQWKLAGVVSNPVRDVPRRKYNNARERYLSTGEVTRLFKALDRSESPQLKHIVTLLLLTGARKTELLTAKWEQIDLDRRTWLIPTTKTGKPRHVPLSQDAINTIAALPRWNGCPWLLPNPTTLKPYTDIKRSWEKARDAAGLHDLHIHDLRHSAASFMINAGIDLYAVG
jgi:integrase